jgi:hypothetical protein
MFYGYLECSTPFWYSFWPLGKFCGHLVYFSKKNLATLIGTITKVARRPNCAERMLMELLLSKTSIPDFHNSEHFLSGPKPESGLEGFVT